MYKNINITTKILGSYLLLIVSVVLISGVGNYQVAKTSLQKQILQDLILVAESEEGYLLEFLEGIKKRVVDFSSDGFIRDSVKNILEGDTTAVQDLSDHLINNKQSLDETIFGINVLNSDGVVIASTDNSEIGLNEFINNDELNTKDLSYGSAILDDVHLGHVHFGFTTAHFTAITTLTDKDTGERLGAIANYVSLIELNKVLSGERQNKLGSLSGQEGRGETLEIYLLNKERLMITESRFKEDVILKQEVNSKPVQLCETKEEMSGIYKNYQGNSVVGASMCLDKGWTLLVEVGEREAFAGLKNIQYFQLIIVTIIIAIGFLYGLFLTRGIVNPIRSLSSAAKKIGAGDLSQKVKVNSRDEIGQLASIFNEMVVELRKSRENLRKSHEKETLRLKEISDLKDQFVFIAAHELKAPVYVIENSLEDIMNTKEYLQKEIKVSVEEIGKANKRLSVLVKDLLQVARIEGKTIHVKISNVSVQSVYKEVMKELADKAEKRGVIISTDIPKTLSQIQAHEIRLREVFINFLSNAIKYSDVEHGEISIKAEEKDEDVIISVSNNGPQISEEDQKHVFQKFWRSESVKSGKEEGTGLGLFIVQQLVEMMDGKVWFESSPNKTTFFVSFKKSKSA